MTCNAVEDMISPNSTQNIIRVFSARNRTQDDRLRAGEGLRLETEAGVECKEEAKLKYKRGNKILLGIRPGSRSSKVPGFAFSLVEASLAVRPRLKHR
ncbi:hypothetical protein KC347_g132 [Hortaea werneckii]|nr:hypothetical protein KC347_g132 [Hortaea werneckii]